MTDINDRSILQDFGLVRNEGGLDYVTFMDTIGDRGDDRETRFTATYYIASTGAYGGGGFRVGVLDSDGNVAPNLTVDVTAPNRYDPTAKVNWGSSGEKTTEVVRVFASVLTLAAQVADMVNATKKVPA